MPDDVLRMRATVSSEEALANIRAIGREFGLLPNRAKPAINSLNQEFKTLGGTIARIGQELRAAVPALGGFGLGAGGVGVAFGLLVRQIGQVSERLVQLKHRSAELGIAENALRGFSEAAAKAGIAPEAFQRSLQTFKRNTEDFQLRIGGVREELIRMGAGPVLNRINAAATQMDKLKVAFDFKQTLDRLDPSGDRGRRFFEDIGLGAEAARLSFDQLARSIKPPLTAEQMAQAQKFHDSLIELGGAWDQLVQKTGIQLFPGLADSIKSLAELLDMMAKLNDFLEKWTARGLGTWMLNPFNPAAGLGELIAPTPGGERAPGSSLRATPQGFTSQGRNPLLAPATGTTGGYQPIAFKEGFGAAGGGDLAEGSRMVKDGVFAALVDFQAYVTGGAGPGGSQGAGAQRVSFGGISGGWSGGGGGTPGTGGDSGARANLTPGTGGASGGQAAPQAAQPMGTLPGADAHGARPMESRGGSAGITAPAGTAIQKGGMTTVTSAGGRKFQVDSRFAQNFQGFIKDYEAAGGVIGPESGTLGHRPHNPSGHPIGAAIDINQVGYGIRGKGGKTLPVETENALAAKWGLVSGANWKRPDTGHFGIKDVAAARQALIDQGLSPSEATEVAKGQAGEAAKANGQTDGKTVRGSWFGNAPGWRDPSEPPGSPKSNRPGIALPKGVGKIGQMYEVTLPDGRTVVLPQTDVGPHQRTGRGIDITAAAAAQLGYTSKTFPTDGNFSYRRVDEANSPQVNATGSVNVNITSNGTAAKTDAKADGMFQNTKVSSYKQMTPTDPSLSMGAP